MDKQNVKRILISRISGPSRTTLFTGGGQTGNRKRTLNINRQACRTREKTRAIAKTGELTVTTTRKNPITGKNR